MNPDKLVTARWNTTSTATIKVRSNYHTADDIIGAVENSRIDAYVVSVTVREVRTTTFERQSTIDTRKAKWDMTVAS